MNIVKVKLSELKPDPNNARKHSSQNILAIKQSLQENPQYRPFVVQKGTNKICVGNGMYTAMQELGIKEGWVEYRDLDEKQFARLSVTDNRTAELAEWDEDILQQIISNYGDDITIPGFGDDVSFNLDDDKEITEDEVPELNEGEPICKLGDIWQLGRHRLICGDSTKEEDVQKLMNGEKADMVFTDPPYGVSYEGGLNEKKKQQIKNDSLRGDILYEFLYDVFTNLKLSTKGKSALYIFYAHSNTIQFINAFYDVGLKQRSIIIWYKQGGGFGDFMAQYMNAYEPCIYGSNGESVNWYGPTNEKTIWEIDKEKKCDLHPTMKPISLVARALKNSSKQGDAVLDLFGGSGSTLIACEQLNRTCYMMELDERYVDVIIKRWQNLTGEQAINETTKQIFNKVAS